MSEPVELLRTQVDLSGLMRVLGNNLYSTPHVALRELVQNAHDSCVRRQIEDTGAFEPAIVVTPDPAKRTLTILDTGAGLTREEVIKYLATVGAGYTGKLRAEGRGGEALIGAFGLGFLSAFVVSERVDLYTTSYQEPSQGWHFQSRGGERYQLGPAPPGPVGTRVVLHLGEPFALLASLELVPKLLERYASLLAFPIHIGSRSSDAVNRPPPPWRSDGDSPLLHRRRSLEFARRFEPRFEPLCTFDVKPEVAGAPGENDVGGGPRGLLWIQDGATYGTSDNRNISVFVRGMLVSPDERDLLPPWAGFAGGVIEADALTPTASREDVQRNTAYHLVAGQIQTALIEGLAHLAENEPATWRRVLLRHNESLLGAAICDPRLFDLLAPDLKVPTSEGELTVPAVRKKSGGKIHISMGEQGGYEEILFRALRVPVVTGVRYAALPFCQAYAQRIGGAVVQLGTKQGNQSLFPGAELPDAKATRLRALFHVEKQEVVPARFAPGSLPLVLVPDRDVLLKQVLERDEADKKVSTAVLGMARLFTKTIDAGVEARLYVNLDAPVIQRILAAEGPAEEARAEQAARLLRGVAGLMAGREEGALGEVAGHLEALSSALLALLGPA
ncbi:MAG: ATP-binding protein [Byssovorax sp.]